MKPAKWRLVTCPKCHVPAGKPCVKFGRRSTNPHHLRLIEADAFLAQTAQNLAGDLDMTHIPFRKVGAG